MTPDKLDVRSHDIVEDRRQELSRRFPEIHTEGGKLDFERLRLTLGEAVDVGKERYAMTWPGKAECFKVIQTPSLGTLRPCPEESVNFDTTENLIIEGDNLEVLKLLQKSYLGKVKMIYIDPPYNTGNDFIYPDNYTESLQTYLEYTGQVDAEGKKFGTNTEADGRFHSKWLSMMYPRLYLARNLLREDGVIFISIDDTEVANLRRLCDEIFGEEGFVATIVWRKKISPDARQDIDPTHDYVLIYARSATALGEQGTFGTMPLTEERRKSFTNPDNDPRGPWASVDMTGMKGRATADQFFEVTLPSGRVVSPPKGRSWGVAPATFQKLRTEGRIWFGKDGNGVPRIKRYISEVKGQNSATWWSEDHSGTTESAKKALVQLFDDPDVFDFPKSLELVRRAIAMLNDPSAIILDFFAGSGTTAHAVLDLNRADGGNRRFILSQLPEPTGRVDYPTIADICKERVRRAINKLSEGDPGKLDLDGSKKQDRGFRVFRLAESNFKTWEAEKPKDAEALAKQLDLHVEHIREGRTSDDLLYEILLKSGFPLTTPVETITLADRKVHSVAEGALLVCLERVLTLELIRAMAERKPERVVCLDAGFAGNDQLKANAVQIFKTKGVTSFKTV
ncbi:MAG: site-specific DNA-methyltransferase [bacterium]